LQRRIRKRGIVEASTATPDVTILTKYEQRRADNIARNARVLAAMGLTPTEPKRKRPT